MFVHHFLAAPQPAPAQPAAPMWSQQPTNGFGAFSAQPPANNTFVSEANFSNVFNNTDTTGEEPSFF